KIPYETIRENLILNYKEFRNRADKILYGFDLLSLRLFFLFLLALTLPPYLI
ncbi:unnamed protein product, partial [marine sediment metagenome]